jgi:hypothetical protein
MKFDRYGFLGHCLSISFAFVGNIVILVEDLFELQFEFTGGYYLLFGGSVVFSGFLIASLTEKLSPIFPFKLIPVCFALFASSQMYFMRETFAKYIVDGEWFANMIRSDWFYVIFFFICLGIADDHLKEKVVEEPEG